MKRELAPFSTGVRAAFGQLGQTTLEYSMLLGIMAILALTVTEWLIDALRQSVALLSFKIAIYLTGFPYP
jgi:hypothetical protein